MNKHKKPKIHPYMSLLALQILFLCMKTPQHGPDENDGVKINREDAEYIAKVTMLIGNVDLLRKGTAEWSILKPNSPLYSDDIIQTDEESRVELRLIDYGNITISEQSLFQISVKLLPDSTKYAASNLKQGSILVNIKKLISGKRFVVRTPTALASIRGTSFRTSVDKVTGKSKIQVLHGEVSVKKRTFKKITQNENIQESINAQKVLDPVKDFSAANIAAVMNDLDDDWQPEKEIIKEKTSETIIVGGCGVDVSDTGISTTEQLSSDDIDSMKNEFSEGTIIRILHSSGQSVPGISGEPEQPIEEVSGIPGKPEQPIVEKQVIEENQPIKQKEPKQKKLKKVDTIYNKNKNIEEKVSQLSEKWLVKGNKTKNEKRKIKYYTKAISCDSSNFMPFYQRGKVRFYQNQFEKARVDFSSALTINPKFSKAYNYRGTAYFNLKRYDEALIDYSRAISIEPNFPAVYVKRGIVYATLKRYNEAIKDYTKAISINPKYALAYYHRGFSCKNLIEKNTITVPSGVAYHNRDQSYKNLKKFNEVIKNLNMYLKLCSDKNGISARNARAAIIKLGGTPEQ